ncbi:MAG: NUDIX domain-containing protein [Candidatus Wallbacteria bacterium]|nr:NUDIX domain-containing protein [Candidatus Wallbacteria bacterium]
MPPSRSASPPPALKRKVQVWCYRLVVGGGPEYLLLRRPRARGSGWQPVTGGFKASETAATAAARELAEETGIGEHRRPGRAGGQRRMLGRVYPVGVSYSFSFRDKRIEEIAYARCVPEDSPIELSKEHVHAHWFTYEQAIARIDWDGQHSALDMLDRSLTRLHAGLDPSPAAPSGPAAALLDRDGRLVAWGTLNHDLAAPGWLPSTVATVGVDAPLTLPFGKGRCCLERHPRCACNEELAPWGRTADRELLELGVMRSADRHGTRVRREWILRSLELADLLRHKRVRLVEVCGLAARRALLEDPAGRAAFRGRLELQRALEKLVPGMPSPAEDLLGAAELDAVLCAQTALLHERGQSRLLGDPAEGAIVIPAEEPAHESRPSTPGKNP